MFWYSYTLRQEKINLLLVKSLTSRRSMSLVKALEEIIKKLYKRFQDNGLTRIQWVQHQNIRKFLTTCFTTHICKILTCWYHLAVSMYNQGSCKSNIPFSTIQDIHNSNDKITNIGSSRLPEQVPIQIHSAWYFKSINDVGSNTKVGYGTEKYSLWLICDDSHWCNKQY